MPESVLDSLKGRLLAAALLGAATVAGFAPLHWFALPVLTIALLIGLWRRCDRHRDALLTGFAFGVGFFGAGVSWVYVSLHDFGAIPMPVAAALTLLFCAVLSLYPAIAGWIYRLAAARSPMIALLMLPPLWTLTEWLRGWLFTGFPWLALGYSQIPVSPLAGYAPVVGVYGISFLIVFSATVIVTAVNRAPRLGTSLAALIAVWSCGALLRHVEWTEPVGQPITASLIQGNIPQDLKWREDRLRKTLDTYLELATASRSNLTVLPETALPLYLHDVPPAYLERLSDHAKSQRGDILIGVPERADARAYYNSVISLGMSPTQTYRKSHLVPFGEFVPLKPLFGWFLDIARIPLLDFSRGNEFQHPLAVAGQLVAVNICYEDAFGEEIIRQLPRATLLVNVSNVAWFGRSIAPRQHLQISQARALESGRYMLRATNTGVTAIIDHRGEVLREAPEFTVAVVGGEVQGYTGATPYVRWGNTPVMALSLLMLAAACWLARNRTGKI